LDIAVRIGSDDLHRLARRQVEHAELFPAMFGRHDDCHAVTRRRGQHLDDARGTRKQFRRRRLCGDGARRQQREQQ
jgi:hypothetical protein